MMNTYTMDLIRLFADKHHFNANEAYDAFLNSLRNNNLSLSKTESNTEPALSEPALSEPALSEPALSEPAVVDTEKSANKGRPKKVKESIIENHEDEELENVNTVIKQLMESDDDDEEEEEEEEEVFQSEELIEYTAAADKAVCSFNVERDPIRYGTVPDRAIAGDIPINVNIPLGTPGIDIKFPPAFDNKVCTGFCPAAGNGNGMAVFNSCVVALAGDDPARPCTCTCP